MSTTPNPHTEAHRQFLAAHAFYTRHGQGDSAIALMVAGLVAMSEQVARIELAVMTAHET